MLEIWIRTLKLIYNCIKYALKSGRKGLACRDMKYVKLETKTTVPEEKIPMSLVKFFYIFIHIIYFPPDSSAFVVVVCLFVCLVGSIHQSLPHLGHL